MADDDYDPPRTITYPKPPPLDAPHQEVEDAHTARRGRIRSEEARRAEEGRRPENIVDIFNHSLDLPIEIVRHLSGMESDYQRDRRIENRRDNRLESREGRGNVKLLDKPYEVEPFFSRNPKRGAMKPVERSTGRGRGR